MREYGLTPRELDILRLVADGLVAGEISTKLYLAPDTVKKHMTHIRQKLNAKNSVQAVAIAIRNNIID